MSKAQLSETEKQQIIVMQLESDGSIRCFISGEVINLDSDDYEFDHTQARVKAGPTDIVNMRVVLKKYNRRKSEQTLYEVRDNLRLEKLFVSKKNSIKLQDILDLKAIERRAIHFSVSDGRLQLTDGTTNRTFSLLGDPILGVNYFYGQMPIIWVQNDDPGRVAASCD